MGVMDYGLYQPPAASAPQTSLGFKEAQPVDPDALLTLLSQQILASIGSKPLPADLTGFNPSELYAQHTATMSGYWDQLNQQQERMRALLDPSQFHDTEQQALNQAKRRPGNLAIYNYGL